MSAIPFMVYHPDGLIEGQMIVRPNNISSMAMHFIERGGRYRLAHRENYSMVELVATMDGPGEEDLIYMARALVPRDTNLPFVVDQLVTESVDKMGQTQ